MKPRPWVMFILGIILGLAGCGRPEPSQSAQPTPQRQSKPDNQPKRITRIEKVREPAVAGLFYPRNRKQLTTDVDQLLADAHPKPVENLRGLVCPHAGYPFSGKTAAVGYKLLAGRDVDTVIVMAPSHYASFEGASIPGVDAYRTPLGLAPLSPKAAELGKVKPFVVGPKCDVRRPPWWRRASKELPAFGQDTPHSWEHSLEVQLPLLQRTLKDFRLVPIVFGRVDPQEVAKGLLKVIDDRTLLVASSDLSHYYRYEIAKKLDTACVEAICSLNPERMIVHQACGKKPILALIHIARKMGWKAKLLDYRNSGDTSGDKSGVVGYAAIAFYKPDNATADAHGDTTARATARATAAEAVPGRAEPQEALRHHGPNEFSPLQRKFLLELARKTVAASVRHEALPLVEAKDVDKALTKQRACFVTLTIGGRLRGCIGSIFPEEPLFQAVIHRAKAAAMADPRFPPVAPKELGRIEIEISVLTLPKELSFDSPLELIEKLRPGIDGVVLRVGSRQATYLPQVWEQIPDRGAFLSRLAKKAGLDPSAWMSDKAKVLIYQVEAFEESEPAGH